MTCTCGMNSTSAVMRDPFKGDYFVDTKNGRACLWLNAEKRTWKPRLSLGSDPGIELNFGAVSVLFYLRALD